MYLFIVTEANCKETLVQAFSCEFSEISKNTFSTEHLQTTASVPHKIQIENFIFLSKYVSNKLPSIFSGWFVFSSIFHNHDSSFPTRCHLDICTGTAKKYGKGAFISMAANIWKNIRSQIKDSLINVFYPNKLKLFLFGFYLNLYQA